VRQTLRIAMIAPPWTGLPPTRYGGIEVVCAGLVEGLVDRGHQVTLFGAGENRTRAAFVQTYAEPQYSRLGQSLPECVHTAAVSRTLARLDVDLVHDHTCAGLLAASARSVPTVATMHGPITAEVRRYVQDCAATTRGQGSLSVVAISDDQRRRGADLPWLGRVHNGVRVRGFPFGARKEDFVLFLGRCSAEKGMDVAIDVARRAGRRLMLAAKCNEPAEQAYFDQHIRPRLGPGVTWLGEVGGQQKLDLLMRARCLIFPIQWDEPFGLVLIEAMSCGTPVVALRRGSVPELVEEGVTGFTTTDSERLCELVDHVDHISPTTCRRVARERFDVDQMAREYEQLYLQLIGSLPHPRSGDGRAHLAASPEDALIAQLTPDPGEAPLR